MSRWHEIRAESLEGRLRRWSSESPSGCWLWTSTLRPNGYPKVQWQGRSLAAHRAAYEVWVGPIPPGLQLDHICHGPSCREPCPHRACINPAHLALATGKVNSGRARHPNGEKTHCLQGHPYDAANTYLSRNVNGRPRRTCRQCRAARERRRRARLN